MIIIGAGGHAKTIAAAISLKDKNSTIRVLCDDENFNKTKLPRLGTFEYFNQNISNEECILGFGDIFNRSSFIKNNPTLNYTSIISPNSDVYTNNIGVGTFVETQAVLHVDTKIGAHCIINVGAVLCHDVIIGDYSHIGANATLCGEAIIGQKTFIATGAIILPKIKIGNNVIVGAGSVVTKNIPDNVVVYGNPAKIIRKNENREN